MIPIVVVVLIFFLALGVLLFDAEPPPVADTPELTNLASFLL